MKIQTVNTKTIAKTNSTDALSLTMIFSVLLGVYLEIKTTNIVLPETNYRKIDIVRE